MSASTEGRATSLDAEPRLVRVLRAAGQDPGLLCSRDVAESLSAFLLPLRAADARSDGGPLFARDDGVVLVAAESSGNHFELSGYIWWISNGVDPLWTRLEIDPKKDVLTAYAIKCGLRRTGTALPTSSGRHLRKVLNGAEPGEIEKAWRSGQLSSELDLWFFDFATPVEPSESLP